MIKKIIIGILGIGLLGIVGLFLLPEEQVGVDEPVGVKSVVKSDRTYFAKLDENDNVVEVIVADQAFIDSGAVGDPNDWVQTWKDRTQRKNYAGKGFKFDSSKDAFIPPKLSAEATFDEATATWIVPDLINNEEIVITATST